LPWLGLIAKIACSDTFVFLDNVQYEKNGWQNRTRYSTSAGLKYLTLPVRQEGIVSGHKTIREIELAEVAAPAKHWSTLVQRYSKAPGWPKIAPRLEAILHDRHEKLLTLCLATTDLTLEIFRLKPKIVIASALPVEGSKGERVVNLVKTVEATHYLSGAGAKEYLEPAAFERAGLGLTFQEFAHPTYQQSTGKEFAPGAFALEWFIADPDHAVEIFHQLLRSNSSQSPRCIF
jgi:hypothetical protein